MKLLVIGPDLRERSGLKNFSGVVTFYLMRELRRRGVETRFVEPGKPLDALARFRELDAGGCEHVLALGQRWFTQQPLGVATALKGKVPGAVTQLNDGVVHEVLAAQMADVDCTFTFRDSHDAGHCYIGWAADPDLFYPMQQRGELRILIDHPHRNGMDYTQAITQDVVAFAHTRRWCDRFKRIRVRRLTDNGAEDVSLSNLGARPFERQPIPLVQIAEEYRHTYVYLPTHRKSLGQTCLETAYCGALVVALKGLVHQDRLDTIRHLTYEGLRVPWRAVLDSCDFKASSYKAREQSWGRVADRLLAWFGDYK